MAVVTAFFSPGGFSYKVMFVLASNARFSTFQNLIMQNMFFLQTALPSLSDHWFSPLCMSEV